MNDACPDIAYADIKKGDEAMFTETISELLAARFTELSGDRNPLHTDAAYAATTRFGRPVVHGMLVGALFSRLIGMHLPGRNSLYLSQTMRFHSPLYAGTVLTIRGIVTHTTDAARTITMALSAKDGEGVLIADGEALVTLLH